MSNETRKVPLLTLEQVAQQAKDTTLSLGSHIPTLIAEGDLRAAIAQLQPLAETHEGRKAQMFLNGLMLVQSGEVGVLQQVFFISEAWLSAARKERDLVIPPSRDPQRKEVLMVSQHVIRSRHEDVLIFEMQRNSRGKLTQLTPFEETAQPSTTELRNPLIDAFLVGYFDGMPTRDH